MKRRSIFLGSSYYLKTNVSSLRNKSRGQVIGFASCGPERDGNPTYRGEMYAIYVLQAYQRDGVGHMLARAVAEQLQHDGYTSMLVWVLAGNKYSRFYERMGGIRIDRKYDTRDPYLVAYG